MLHPRNNPADAPMATVIEHMHKLNYNTVFIAAVRVRINPYPTNVENRVSS